MVGCISDGQIKRIASDRTVTRLGENLIKTGKLDSRNAELSIRSLITFKALCDDFNVVRIKAVGTSALRDALNADEFHQIVKDKTGMDIEVISGEREADLTLLGIRGKGDLFRDGCSLVIDVGGGSTELIVCEGEKCTRNSLPIGAVKLFEQFISNDPPTDLELREIRSCIKVNLSALLPSFERCATALIATGGTSTTLASINLGLSSYDGNKVHGHVLSYATIQEIFENLRRLSMAERNNIVGLEEGRTDIIIPGSMIILEIMETLGKREMIVSDYGLMEGLLLEVAAVNNSV